MEKTIWEKFAETQAEQDFEEAHIAYWDQPVSGTVVIVYIVSLMVGFTFVGMALNSLCGGCLQ